MSGTPEHERYDAAFTEIRTRMNAAPDQSARGALQDLGRTLREHRPEDDPNPDCGACGTTWPCPTANPILATLDS